ncbi:choice-of-anchor tandem repeat GloVer-containing protein [Verrucomicrobiota bacterium sgz303538]
MSLSIGFGKWLHRVGYIAVVCSFSMLSARGDFASVKTLHQFPGEKNAQWSLCTPLTRASDGTLYGVAYTAPEYDSPGVYRLESSGAITPIPGVPRLISPLVSGSGGALYGYGTYRGVYRILPSGEVAQTAQLSDLDSESPFVLDDEGFLYWTTFYDTNSRFPYEYKGVVYRLSSSGEETKLYEFRDRDGEVPATLIAGRDGYLYGVTRMGGKKPGSRRPGGGVVFRLSKTGEFKVLHVFDLNEGSAWPSLLHGKDGYLYGTRVGGAWKLGFLFRIDPKSREYTVLHNFRGSDGASPFGPLTEDDNGYIYGTTPVGGPGGHGVVYRLRPGGGVQVVYGFSGLDGSGPVGGLVKKGNAFFGVTRQGGTLKPEFTQGTVFQLDIPQKLTEPGHWDGLLRTFAPEPRVVGSASLKVTAEDTFSIAVRFGRDRVAWHGQFDTTGRYTRQRVRGQKCIYTVELRNFWTGRVHGRVSDGKTSATFDLVPGVPGRSFANSDYSYFRVNPRMNLLLSPKTPDENPAIGFVHTRIGKNGRRIIAIGALPDGTPFSTGATVGLGFQVGLYAPLFDRYRGSITGTLDLFGKSQWTTPTSQRCPGGLTWTRPGHEQSEIKFNAFYSH